MRPTRDEHEHGDGEIEPRVTDPDDGASRSSHDDDPDPYADSPGAGIDADEVPEPNEPG